MKNVIICNKEIGETPLECLERMRIEYSIGKEIPMTYAGRLDPMAEGLLPILIGEECKNKEKYMGLDKEYEIEILLGIETDSYDILGIIENIKARKICLLAHKFFFLHKFRKKTSVPRDFSDIVIDFSGYIGKQSQKYPRYSSKIIAMKEIPEEMPEREVEIYLIDELGEIEKSGEEIARESIDKIKKVNGDFRQEKIIESWQKFAEEYSKDKFKIIKLKVACSSGTYMRVLAYRIGEDMGVGAIAMTIKRTKIC